MGASLASGGDLEGSPRALSAVRLSYEREQQ